jgi:hypothetical protein
MEEKKIATSVDILINIDRFEHLQITKYSEKKITYETNEEMVQKEDQMTKELVADIRRTLKKCYEDFSGVSKEIAQKMESVTKIDGKISKKMPTWLEDGYEPNIANSAKKQAIKSEADAYVKKEDREEELNKRKEVSESETENFLEEKSTNTVKLDEKDASNDLSMDDDLFGDDLFKD